MNEDKVTTRCSWCGMINVMDGWHLERRTRLSSYAYTICALCSVREVQILEASTTFADGVFYHGVRQAIAEQALRGWKN